MKYLRSKLMITLSSIIIIVLVISALCIFCIPSIREPKALISRDRGYEFAKANGKIQDISRKAMFNGYEVQLKEIYSDGLRCFVEVLLPQNQEKRNEIKQCNIILENKNGKKYSFDNISSNNKGNRAGYILIDNDFNEFSGGEFSIYENAIGRTDQKKWNFEIMMPKSNVKVLEPKKNFGNVYISRISIAAATIKLSGTLLSKIDFDRLVVIQNKKDISYISVDLVKDKKGVLFNAVLPPEFDATKKFKMVFYKSGATVNSSVIEFD